MNTIQHACEIVKAKLQSGEWAQGERMPSLAELSGLCKVSRTTMWKAAGLLQKDLAIHMKGKAIMAGPPGIPLLGSQNAAYASNQLCQRIGREIVDGSFPKEGLPPLYKAAAQYGVAINTLKKALDKLIKEGLLVKKGRKYSCVSGWTKSHQQEMVLISEGESGRNLSIHVWRTEQIVTEFERECLRLGYVPRCLGFDGRDARGIISIAKSIRAISNTAGYVVNLFNPWSETQWRRWLDLLQMLVGFGIPVIVIDQEGDLLFPNSLISSKNFRVLRISGIRAGELVAAALLARRHNHVSYITPFYTLSWAQKRYEGLYRYYQKYGSPEAKVEICAFSEITPDSLTFSILGLDAKDLQILFKERYSNEQLAGVQKELDAGRKLNFPGRLKSLPNAGTVRDNARFLVSLMKKKHSPAAYDSLLETLLHIASNTARQWYLQLLLEKALKNNTSTAWVCSDIATTLAATLLLQSRGAQIPREKAVIGFENVHESLEYQLSTYDFNMRGMVQQALLMIIDERMLKSKPPMSEVDGYVVERMTTRR